jgi:hypothetical protein
MFKLVLNFNGKPALVVEYRGKSPVSAYARRQRAIYRADSVDVFDDSGALVYTALPRKGTRGRRGRKRPPTPRTSAPT